MTPSKSLKRFEHDASKPQVNSFDELFLSPSKGVPCDESQATKLPGAIGT
jgi:hypothetical protein